VLKDTTNKEKNGKPSSTGCDFKAASQPKIRTKTKAQMHAGKKLVQQRAKETKLFGEPIDDKIIAATVQEDPAVEAAIMGTKPDEVIEEDGVVDTKSTTAENEAQEQLTVQPAAESLADAEQTPEGAASTVSEPETNVGGAPDAEMGDVGAWNRGEELPEDVTAIEIEAWKVNFASKLGLTIDWPKSEVIELKPKAQLSEDIVVDSDEVKSASTEDTSLLPQ
jgi:hypothetical protein